MWAVWKSLEAISDLCIHRSVTVAFSLFIYNFFENIINKKSYDRSYISWYMVTRNVFQVLKLHSPAARAILRTFKTSLVPIYHVMHSRSYDFLYLYHAIQCNLRFRISAMEIQRVRDKPEDPFSHELKSAVSSVNIILIFVRLLGVLHRGEPWAPLVTTRSRENTHVIIHR